MFFALILIHELLCYFSEISNGFDKLPNTNITVGEELSLEKVFLYEGKNWQYLIMFKRNNLDTKELIVLSLLLPFKKELIKNDRISMRQENFKFFLNEFFSFNNLDLYKSIFIVKINVDEREYIKFKVFEYFEIVLKQSDNKLYSYSNFSLLEFTAVESLFEKFEYGVKKIEKIIFFDNIFLLVASDVPYVIYGDYKYDKDEMSMGWTIRNFFVEPQIVWAITDTEKDGMFLKVKPFIERDGINRINTETEKDTFEILIDSKTLAFSFGFKDKIETNPKIRINETEIHETSKKINKLVFVGMIVSEFKLESLELIHIITPKFVFEENLPITDVAFFVYYDVWNETEGETNAEYNYKLVFYSLNNSECLVEIEIDEEGDIFIVILKKIIQNGYLYFKVEDYIEKLTADEYNLSIVPDGSHPELGYAYTYLKLFLHENINGSFVRSEKNENQVTVIGINPRKTSGYLKKNSSGLFVVLILLFIAILPFSIVFFKKLYLKKKKLRFQKKSSKKNV